MQTSAGRHARVFLVLSLLGASAAACASAPPPKPKPIAKPQPVAKAPPPPPPLAPSRWARAGGATTMGPAVEGGTLVLVGGRRALVAKDGSVRAETEPSPELLHEIIEVPTESGARRLVARGTNGIYRLEDPLGAVRPLVRSESELVAIGAAAGMVAVWTYGHDMPRFVDVETGRTRSIATLPALPMRAVAFRNAKEGAGIFDGVGLATTSDGGATWKRVSEAVRGDALWVNGVRLRDGALRAFVFEEGRDAPIDAAKASLGRLEEGPAEAAKSPLLRWIRATHRDPLSVAVSAGVELPGGGALVASHGVVARVDTTTGLVTAAEEFAHGPGMTSCTVGRAGKDALVACALSADNKGDYTDPYGVLRVPLDAPDLKLEPPVLVRNGEAELRTSTSGGAMLMSPCSSEEDGEVCVRQPDGKWITLRSDVSLHDRAAGPLADGRVAFLRNMFEGDTPEDHPRNEDEEAERAEAEAEAEAEGEGREQEVPEARRLYVAALDTSGKEERIATLAFRPLGDLRVASPLEEGEDRALHMLFSDDEGLYAVAQPKGQVALTPARLQGMAGARMRAGRGAALGEERVQATTDGGKTWHDVQLPEAMRQGLPDLASLVEDTELFGVSEVGALFDQRVRIGWGTPAPGAEPKEARFDTTLGAVTASAASGPERVLTCTSEAASVQGTPPLSSSNQVPALLGKKGPAPKGTRRAVLTAPMAKNGLMDAVAFFEEEGSDKPGTPPAKWTMSWHDATEIGGKPRQLTLTPPKDTPWGTMVRAAAASGPRALFTLTANRKFMLVRTKPGGGAEIAEVGVDLLPSNEIVFGTDKGEPIAWLRDTAIVVWVSGDQPRVAGYVSSRPGRSLGEPTKDGVPVLVGGQDWSAMRLFPIPATDKKGAPAPPPPAPTLSDWTATPNVRQQLGRLPACGAKPKGARFVLTRSYARATMDGAGGGLAATLYDVRVSPGDACVAQISTLFTPDRTAAPPPPPPAKPGSKPAAPAKKGPVAFVRADLAGKRAEGGDRGLPGKDAMRRLACTLEERK
jgi:hypothetical protein